MKTILPSNGRRLIAGFGILAAMLLFGTVPARADSFRIGVGPHGGINFSYSSGGYCDKRGCPRDFWDLPVYYCPVYNRGRWYRGPVYYKHTPRGIRFWIRGAWRPDRWRGPRPPWACTDRMGPPLGFRYYEHHGFRMKPQWRKRWMRAHPHDHHGDMRRPGDRGPRDLRPRGERHDARGMHRDHKNDVRNDSRSMHRDRKNDVRNDSRSMRSDRKNDARRGEQRKDAKPARRTQKQDVRRSDQRKSDSGKKSDKDKKDDKSKDRHNEHHRR